jgi:VWFA-related protein
MNRLLFNFILSFSLVSSTFAQQPAAPNAAKPRQQEPDQDEVVRISTNLVQIDAVVTDSKGRQITDLTADDFELKEDERPQKITNVSYVSIGTPASGQLARVPPPAANPNEKVVLPPPPKTLRPVQVHRTLALVVDDLGLSFESIAYVRQALRKFVDTQMNPGDLVAVIRSSAGAGALQQFTSDKR